MGREQPPKYEGRGGVLNSPKVSLEGSKARKTVWHSKETLDASLPLHRRQEDRAPTRSGYFWDENREKC